MGPFDTSQSEGSGRSKRTRINFRSQVIVGSGKLQWKVYPRSCDTLMQSLCEDWKEGCWVQMGTRTGRSVSEATKWTDPGRDYWHTMTKMVRLVLSLIQALWVWVLFLFSNSEQWYIIFRIFVNFLNKLILDTWTAGRIPGHNVCQSMFNRSGTQIQSDSVRL